VQLRATEPGYDPTEREAAYRFARSCHDRGELATGLLFINKAGQSLHDMNRTVTTPLTQLPFAALCPGKAALETLMERYR
jgi:2-oxoglutarate ferredoxin oxidoreductase subunit beta